MPARVLCCRAFGRLLGRAAMPRQVELERRSMPRFTVDIEEAMVLFNDERFSAARVLNG